MQHPSNMSGRYSKSPIPSPSRSRRARRSRRDWGRKLRYLYYRFVRMHSSPSYLARGLAVGVFSGFLPFFGLQIFLSVAVASLLRGHKVVAAAATWISNPFTYVPLYGLGFHVGRKLLNRPAREFGVEMFNGSQGLWTLLGDEFAAPMILGCVLLGLVASTVSYFAAMYLLLRAKHRRRRF